MKAMHYIVLLRKFTNLQLKRKWFYDKVKRSILQSKTIAADVSFIR